MRRPLAAAGLLFILILFIIQLIYPARIADYSEYDGDTLTVTGRLVRIEYKRREDELRTLWYLDKVHFEESDLYISDNDMILCYMDEYPEDTPTGTIVTARGRIRAFDAPANPGQFDMRRYYDICHISVSMTGTDTIWCDRSHITPAWRVNNRLSVIRSRIGALCDLCFDENDSSVIKAMLLGDKSAMSPDTKSLYSRNGIAHILAISGLHISMLGTALVSVLKKLRFPTFPSAVSAIILMILYGFMTGMAASALRAVIMFSLRMLADILHRTYDMATALIIAAVLVLTGQPAYLFYSGFQFSFGAVGAILLILPVMDKVFPKLISGCLSVNIATLPIYLYNYYYFPVISVILNLYIIPLMSVLLGCAIVAVAGCAAYIPLGRLLALPARFILLIYEWSCRLSDMTGFNRFVTGRPSNAALVIYTVIVAATLIFNKRQTRLQIMMNLAFGCIMLTTTLRIGIDITLIDVGQGDGIYITDNCGTDILIDGGSTDVSDVGAYRIAPFLLSQGAGSLDAVFITHMDADHYNGVLEMIKDGGLNTPKIKALYLTSSTHKMGGDAYDELTQAAYEHGVDVYSVTAGDMFDCGTLRFNCMYPDKDCPGLDTNNESLVLDMEYTKNNSGIHMLFTGDLGGDGETALTRALADNASGIPDARYRILKCAHHGSNYSTYDPFLDEYRPDLALISAGHGNSYGHPGRDTLNRLDTRSIPHFCTIDHGALTVHISDKDVIIKPYLDHR